MAGPLKPKPLPPPLSSLMAVEILERWKKRFEKKVTFSLMARPLREDLFFAASLREAKFYLDH